MPGAINFSMTDLYGGGYAGTGDLTVPEAADQTALVDDEAVAATVASQTRNKVPIFAALALVVLIAFIIGAVRK